jgi:hypothetical protein
MNVTQPGFFNSVMTGVASIGSVLSPRNLSVDDSFLKNLQNEYRRADEKQKNK